MTSIVPLAARHCRSVTRLHLVHLSSGFKGGPGRHLLQIYYRTVAEQQGACGYVAEMDGGVIGYVCGVWDPSAVRYVLLSKYWPQLTAWGIVQVVVYPRLMSSLFGRLRSPFSGSGVAEPGYELRPIVVVPAARGSGLAAELVHALLDDAARRGFERIHLLTELDNAPANAFYRKVGFQSAGRLSRTGTSYIRYEMLVS